MKRYDLGDLCIDEFMYDELIGNGTTLKTVRDNRLSPIEDRIFESGVVDILVLSRKEAITYIPDRPYWIVGLCDPTKDLPKYPKSDKLKGGLQLQFYDSNLPEHCIKPEQAQRIVDYVNLCDAGDLIIVHCEAGLRRSSGCAAAIADGLEIGSDFFFKRYIPNSIVYKEVLDAFKSRE